MRRYVIAERDAVLKHSWRCIDDDGYVMDDYTHERVRCPICGGSMVLRYDFEEDHGYMVCNGNFIGSCNFSNEIIIKTPPCKLCGRPTILRSRGLGGKVFLGCEHCLSQGKRTRIQIGNAVFSDL